ncbi:MAG TPA: sugar phosphate isomerase/epimerase family protein [Anaerolineae bacterium]
MKTSCSAFVYLNFSLAEALRHIAAAGFDGVDFWGGRPHAYRRDLDDGELRELCRVLGETGLGVASFIPAQFRYPTSLCSANDKIRADSVAYIKDSVVTAAELSAPIVSVCPGHTLHGQTITDGWARLSDSLDQICEFADRHGIRIAMEPADRYETDLMQTTAEALRMCRELGHANLGVVLDNGHAHAVGEPAEAAVAALGDRLFHVHVDDNNGLRDQHLIPGDGTFDFPPFFAGLAAAGYAGYLCAELSWDYTVDPDAAATLTARRLRDLLATKQN